MIETLQIQIFQNALQFSVFAAVLAFFWAPLLIKFLYKNNITRKNEYDATLSLGARKSKKGVPIMGGLLVIITVTLITVLFNWERKFTYMPILLMLFAAIFGGLDDFMNNVRSKKRRVRNLKQTLKLIRVHKQLRTRIWLTLTLPWALFKRASLWLGSHPGKGLHVHERLLFQFTTGAIAAYWIYFKLGSHWRDVQIPFDGFVHLGWMIIPIIIFTVMFMANAVNVADGMDGLAGGSLTTTFAALTLLSWLEGYPEMTYLNATVVGALIAYTYFNVKPARFQMGDVGSLALGTLLAINAIVINKMLILPFLAGIFCIELASVVIQIFGKYLLGRRIFKMAPIHHHFEIRGWSEEKTVMRFWLIHAGFVIIGIWLGLH